MSDIVKKGLIEVKKKNIFAHGYKQKFIVLCNSAPLRCKVVEISDGEERDKSPDLVRLTSKWVVQHKPSSTPGRYGFQLVMGDEPVLTFSCYSVEHRDEWMDAFHILYQLALPCFTFSHESMPISDFFSVTLVKTPAAIQLGCSGQFLLSISTSAVALHWQRTHAIAHQWHRNSIDKLYPHPKRPGCLILRIHSGENHITDYEFVTERKTAMQVLKLWNIKLLETIQQSAAPPTPSSSLVAVDEPKVKKSSSKSKSKSFRSKKHAVKESDNIRRTGSFSESLQHSTGLSQGSAFNPQVLPPMRTAARDTRAWSGGQLDSGGILSQDSFFAPSSHSNGVPPPLPPRPEESSSDEDDPDYAYIDERKVKGPGNRSQSDEGEPTVDDQLAELKRDIVRENKARKRAAAAEVNKQIRGAHRLHRPSPPVLSPSQYSPRSPRSGLDYAASDASDYLEPVPSKRLQSQSSDYESPVNNHLRSFSEPDPFPLHSPIKLSQPSYQMNDTGLLQPGHQRNIRSRSPHSFHSDEVPGSNTSPVNISPPTLPPRTSRYGSTTSNASINSSTSATSSVGTASVGLPPRSSSMPKMSTEDGAGDFKGVGGYGTNRPNASEGSVSPKTADGGIQTMTIPEEPVDTTSPPSRKISPMQEQTDHITLPTSDSPPPPIPPRSPTKERLSRKSSSSSISSNSSSRCPRCRSFRNTRSTVGKTVSLDHRVGTSSVEDCEHSSVRKSLPDLNNASPVPENSLLSRHSSRHSHHCSHTSCGKSSPESSSDALATVSTPSLPSAQKFEYLQLIGGDQPQQKQRNENDNPTISPLNLDSELGPELDLLTSCLQTLEYLENKVKSVPSSSSSGTPNSLPLQPSPTAVNSSTSPNEDQRRAIQTDLHAAMRQAQQVQADLTAPPRRLPTSGHQTGENMRSVSNIGYRNAHHTGVMRSHTMSTIPSSSTQQQQQQQQPRHHSVMNHSHSNGSLPQVPPLRSSTSSFRSVPPTSSSTPSGPPSSAAPPVPPRSRVSLGQESPPSFNLNRSISGGSFPPEHSNIQQPSRPLRSATSLGHQPYHYGPEQSSGSRPSSSMSSNQRFAAHHGHSDTQSSTVFVHHLADRRLAHMV